MIAAIVTTPEIVSPKFPNHNLCITSPRLIGTNIPIPTAHNQTQKAPNLNQEHSAQNKPQDQIIVTHKFADQQATQKEFSSASEGERRTQETTNSEGIKLES